MILEMCEKVVPWKLYRMASSGHRVTPVSYGEDGTLTVAVRGKYNYVTMERQVFGVHVDDLTECDLPGPDERVGCYADEVAEKTGRDVEEVEDELVRRLREKIMREQE